MLPPGKSQRIVCLQKLQIVEDNLCFPLDKIPLETMEQAPLFTAPALHRAQTPTPANLGTVMLSVLTRQLERTTGVCKNHHSSSDECFHPYNEDD